MVGDLASRTGHITFKGMGMRASDNNVLVVPVLTGDIATTALSSTNTPIVSFNVVCNIGLFLRGGSCCRCSNT